MRRMQNAECRMQSKRRWVSCGIIVALLLLLAAMCSCRFAWPATLPASTPGAAETISEAPAVKELGRPGFLLYAIGPALVIAAVVACALGVARWGVAAFLGGVAWTGSMLFFSRYPWALWIPVGLAFAAFGYALYVLVRSQRARQLLESTLGVVVEGVERAAPSQAKAVKSSIKESAGEKLAEVKEQVNAIKASHGLPL